MNINLDLITSIIKKSIPKYAITDVNNVMFKKIKMKRDTFEKISNTEKEIVQKTMETNPNLLQALFDKTETAISSQLGLNTYTPLHSMHAYTGDVKTQMIKNLEKIYSTSQRALYTLLELSVKKSKKPEIVKIEKELLEKFGVKTCFSDNIEIANLTKDIIRQIVEKGRKPPKEIKVSSFWTEGGIALSFKDKKTTTEAIFLSHNINPSFFNDGYASTQQPGHVIVHEFAHIEDWRKNGMDKWLNQTATTLVNKERILSARELQIISKDVGEYAGGDVNSGLEVFPEIYTNLFFDGSYSNQIMDLYTRKLNGIIFQK